MGTQHIHPAEIIYDEIDKKLELLERRSSNSKTFRIADGLYQLHAVAGPIHYKRDGLWHDIDLTIQEKKGKKVMDTAPYEAEAFTDRVGHRFTSPDGNYEIELVKLGGIPVDNSRFKAHHKDHQFFWDNVADGVDIKLMLFPGQPSTFTQLRDENSPKSLTWKITSSGDLGFISIGGDMKQDKLEILTSKTDVVNGSYFYEETWTGRVARRKDPKTRKKTWENDPVYPVVLDPTVTKNISVNGDDGSTYFSQHSNVRSFRNSVLKVSDGVISGFTAAGWRFQSVNIPAGTTVTSAKLKLTTKNVKNVGGSIEALWGDKVANAAAWSNTSRPDQITKTTTKTTFTPVKNAVNSINATGQVNSILGLGGWASNNAMRFAIQGSVIGSLYGGGLSAYDHNTSAAKAGQLIIVYGSTGNKSSFFMLF